MIWSVFKIGVRIDKNKRIGEKSINNYGFVMTIIDYIDCNNVTIQFEDGEIVENIYYYNFKKGAVKKKNNKYNINFNLDKKLSLGYLYPKIAKMIAIKENDLTFNDTYYILPKSGVLVFYRCNDCGMLSKNKKRICDIVNYYSCEFCSDGISIPNKFMANVLKQLKIDFITELNKSDFKWCGYFKYDFYLPRYNMIIEVNGEQHYKECSLTSRTLEQEQWNDLFKYKCAKSHVDNYIVIDCRKSTLEWMKNNVIKELSDYFNLSNINWELTWEESQKSLCIEAWELWNKNKSYTSVDIANILNVDRSTIHKYLKIGEEINKITYKRRMPKRMGNCPIICITTKRPFVNIKEASDFYNCYSSGICKCCKGKIKSHKGLVWKYVKINHNKKYKILNDTMDNM